MRVQAVPTVLVPALVLLALLGGCVATGDSPGADPSAGSPTATETVPPKPPSPPVPDGVYVAGPMAPECQDHETGPWTYPPMDSWSVEVDETWTSASEAVDLAEALANRSGRVADLRPVEGSYWGIGWGGEIVDVEDAHGTDRFVVATEPDPNTEFAALVLGYDNQTEVVFYETLGYC